MSSLKEINGRYYNSANVVMLPTKDLKAPILCNLKEDYIQYFSNEYWSNDNLTKRHLYITSDEKIKEGEYAIVPMLGGGFVAALIVDISKTGYVIFGNYARLIDLGCQISECKKIIVTTDKSLGLPQSSQSFIKAYIEAYNSGKPITKVMVEIEPGGSFTDFDTKEIVIMKQRLKVDKDNYITIKPIKDSWNREEIPFQTIKSIIDSIKNSDIIQTKEFDMKLELLDKWIEENL